MEEEEEEEDLEEKVRYKNYKTWKRKRRKRISRGDSSIKTTRGEGRCSKSILKIHKFVRYI